MLFMSLTQWETFGTLLTAFAFAGLAAAFGAVAVAIRYAEPVPDDADIDGDHQWDWKQDEAPESRDADMACAARAWELK
jgi:hypothetical protein